MTMEMNKTLCSSSKILLESYAGQKTILWNLLSDLPPSGKHVCLTPATAGTFKNTEIKCRTAWKISWKYLYSNWQVSGFENGYRHIKLMIYLSSLLRVLCSVLVTHMQERCSQERASSVAGAHHVLGEAEGCGLLDLAKKRLRRKLRRDLAGVCN